MNEEVRKRFEMKNLEHRFKKTEVEMVWSCKT